MGNYNLSSISQCCDKKGFRAIDRIPFVTIPGEILGINYFTVFINLLKWLRVYVVFFGSYGQFVVF